MRLLLDLIGDLALVGFPQAQVLVYKGSHGLHTDLAYRFVTESTTPDVVLTSEQIALLPPLPAWIGSSPMNLGFGHGDQK